MEIPENSAFRYWDLLQVVVNGMKASDDATCVVESSGLIHEVSTLVLLEAHDVHLSVVDFLEVNNDSEDRLGDHVK